MTTADTTPLAKCRHRPPQAPVRGRGHPLTVTMRRTTALAGLLEGIALCDEVLIGTERIHAAAAAGSRAAVVHEAGRLGFMATAARTELRRLARGMDE